MCGDPCAGMCVDMCWCIHLDTPFNLALHISIFTYVLLDMCVHVHSNLPFDMVILSTGSRHGTDAHADMCTNMQTDMPRLRPQSMLTTLLHSTCGWQKQLGHAAQPQVRPTGMHWRTDCPDPGICAGVCAAGGCACFSGQHLCDDRSLISALNA